MKLDATMTLDASRFQGPLSGIIGNLGKFTGALAMLPRLVGGAVGAFAAFKGVQSTIQGLGGAIAAGANLQKLSRVTGETVASLSLLQTAFREADMDASGVAPAVAQLQRALGGVNDEGKPTKAIFDQLGLSITDLQRLNAPQQFAAIGAKLRELPNAAQQTAAAMAIFGRSGSEMMALFRDPDALTGGMRAGAQTAATFARAAKVFADIDNTIVSIKGKLAGMWAGIAEGLAPMFKAALSYIQSLPIEEFGQKLGNVFKVVTQAFRENALGDLLLQSLSIAAQEVGNVISKSITAIAGGIGSLLDTLPGVLAAAFETLTNADFWTGIAQLALGAFESLGAGLLNIFMKPLTYLQAGMDTIVQRLAEGIGKIPGLGKALGLSGYTASSFQENLADRKKNGFFLADAANMAAGFGAANRAMGLANIAAATSGLRAPTVGLLEGALSGMKEGWADGAIFDTLEARTKLANTFNGLLSRFRSSESGEIRKPSGIGEPSAPAEKREFQIPKLGPSSDSLARIGGYIGGIGPSLDYARRTATAVEKLTKLVESSMRSDGSKAVDFVLA